MMNLLNESNSQQMRFCKRILNAPFFVFEESYMEYYKSLFKREKGGLLVHSFPDSYSWNENEKLPLLWCSYGETTFHVGKYSNHEGHILYSNSAARIGVAIESNEYIEITNTENEKLTYNALLQSISKYL